MTLSDLISRLEALEGPDYAVDLLVKAKVRASGRCKTYTHSRDAADSAMPEGWQIASIGYTPGHPSPWCVHLVSIQGEALASFGQTEPNTRTAAALRARQAMEE